MNETAAILLQCYNEYFEMKIMQSKNGSVDLKQYCL